MFESQTILKYSRSFTLLMVPCVVLEVAERLGLFMELVRWKIFSLADRSFTVESICDGVPMIVLRRDDFLWEPWILVRIDIRLSILSSGIYSVNSF